MSEHYTDPWSAVSPARPFPEFRACGKVGTADQGSFRCHAMSKRKSLPKLKRTRTSRCRDCGAVAEVDSGAFGKAASPRCVACGGIVDQVRPSFTRRSPQRKK